MTSRIVTAEHTISSRTVGQTDSTGTVSDTVLSPNVTFEVCGRSSGYDSNCVRDVRLQHDDEHVTIRLQPARGHVVQLVANPPVGPGRVYNVIGDRVAGEAFIEPDHTVRLDPGVPIGALYLVAANYPLLRLDAPNFDEPQPHIVVPRSNGVLYTITLTAAGHHRGGPVAIAIDGTPLPDAVLTHAQALHNTSEPYLHPGESIVIGPLDEHLHASVLLWHANRDLPENMRVPDPFTNPMTAALVYRAPLNRGHVILNPER